MCEEYYGWKNRETWATALHIDNDMFLLDTALDYAKRTLEENEDETISTSYLTEEYRYWIEEDLLTLENIKSNEGLWLMLTDIGSLYRVDWWEIARHYLDQVREQVSA